MNARIEDRPEYAHYQEFKKVHAWELMRRYGAHGLGIGRKKVDGKATDQLALIFYVERRSESEAETIPATLSFTPAGSDETVELVTDVVESPRAELELKPE